MADSIAERNFYRTVVEGAHDLIAAFDETGEIVFATESTQRLLGVRSGDVIGENIVDYIHPEDLDQVFLVLGYAGRQLESVGSGVIRLLDGDGEPVPVDVSLGEAFDGGRRLLVAFCRFALSRQSESETLLRLLDGLPTAEVLAPLVNAISWQNAGSHMAIVWDDHGVRRCVHTGLNDHLCGISDADPWGSVRASGTGVLSIDLSGLDATLRSHALDADRGGYWVEPVPAPGTDEPALVTIWTPSGGVDPRIHEIGMQITRRYLGVVLEFVAQRRALNHTVSHDGLTGLHNRAALEQIFDAETTAGALLFCDLDRFKSINDTFGHAIGDELLRLAGRRLQGCARADDLVARLGGDEFVVFVRETDRQRIEVLARRIVDAFAQPFTVEGRVLDVGMSIGLSVSRHLTGAALRAADQAMYDAKSMGRGRFRWAEPLD